MQNKYSYINVIIVIYAVPTVVLESIILYLLFKFGFLISMIFLFLIKFFYIHDYTYRKTMFFLIKVQQTRKINIKY